MALALDGTPVTGAQSGGNTIVTSSLTTSNGSGNIVVAIATNAASISSVTAAGLTHVEVTRCARRRSPDLAVR